MASFTQYLLPSIILGVVIAIDVFIVTTLRYKDSSMGLLNWSLPLTATHMLFPAFGYFVFWSAQVAYPQWSWIIGLIGFFIIFLLVYELFCEFAQLKPLIAISDSVNQWLNVFVTIQKESVRHGLIILGLSWDALFSSPGIEAIAKNWSTTEVLWSFLIIGTAVFILTQAALLLAWKLRKIKYSSVEFLTRLTVGGKLAELSVIGSFGILSLWNVFSSETQNLYQSIVVSTGIILFFFTRYRERIEIKARGNAIAAVCSY